jgi:hypothetical protein
MNLDAGHETDGTMRTVKCLCRDFASSLITNLDETSKFSLVAHEFVVSRPNRIN